MIRVLHVVGRMILGGTQAMIMNIYRNIDREKLQFDFIVDHADEMYFEEEIEKLGGRIYRMPRYKGYNTVEIYREWNKFFSLHPEYRILHSHVRSYASLYLPIAKRYGCKTVIHSHSTSNGEGFSAKMKNILQFPLRFQANYFLACSDAAGKWLFGKRIVKNPHYYVLINGIDIYQYKYSAAAKERLRGEFGIGDEIIFGHVGRFREAKNHLFLLNVYKYLISDFPNSKLILVGDGELREDIERSIKNLGLERNVILTGERGDAADFFSLFHCLIFPSKWEGFGITVLEAQASGIPIFVSDHIPSEVIVTDSVKKISLDKECNIWRKEIVNTDMKRVDNSGVLIKKGFDVRTTTEWISKFYMEIVNE